MDRVYYNGELIPAEDWDYTLSKPNEDYNLGKKEPKKVAVSPAPEVSTPQE